jgi:hypothetical protein
MRLPGAVRALLVPLALLAVPAQAGQCKSTCEGYYDSCRKDCSSGDRCATDCEDDQQVCMVSCKRNHGNRASIDQDLAARRRARERARKTAEK